MSRRRRSWPLPRPGRPLCFSLDILGPPQAPCRLDCGLWPLRSSLFKVFNFLCSRSSWCLSPCLCSFLVDPLCCCCVLVTSFFFLSFPFLFFFLFFFVLLLLYTYLLVMPCPHPSFSSLTTCFFLLLPFTTLYSSSFLPLPQASPTKAPTFSAPPQYTPGAY